VSCRVGERETDRETERAKSVEEISGRVKASNGQCIKLVTLDKCKGR
jgi:hypothetical protein